MSLGAALRRPHGSATNFGWTERWPTRGSANAGFPTAVCCECAQTKLDPPSPPSDESLASPDRASKVVADLSDRDYVRVADSTTSKREKSVVLTPLGVDYLAHRRVAAQKIEDEMRAELGDATFTALGGLLSALDAGEGVRNRVPTSLVQHLTRAGMALACPSSAIPVPFAFSRGPHQDAEIL